MNITIADSNLNHIKIHNDDLVDIFNYIWESDNNSFVFLSSIDPYGKTIFSKDQVNKYIIDEFNDLKDREISFGDRIDEILKFIRNIDYHQFITFIGD